MCVFLSTGESAAEVSPDPGRGAEADRYFRAAGNTAMCPVRVFTGPTVCARTYPSVIAKLGPRTLTQNQDMQHPGNTDPIGTHFTADLY